MKAAKDQVAHLQTRPVLGGTGPEPTLDELADHLKRAEEKIAGPLSQRVLALGILRGTQRAIARSTEGTEDERAYLRERAAALHARLRDRERSEFGLLRERVRAGTYGPTSFQSDIAHLSVDDQDAFAERLIDLYDYPEPEEQSDADHAPHGLSPLQDILAAAEHIGSDDVVYDLGSGSGKVCLLLELLTGARLVGVEYDRALVKEAERARDQLGMKSTFIGSDVREVTFEDATVFFMYEPFRGDILNEVLQAIRRVAATRPVKLIARFKTYDALSGAQGLEPVGPPGPTGQQLYTVHP